VLSKYHNANGAKFGYKLEDNSLKAWSFIPGPGAYESPSDFGRLDILDLKKSRWSKIKLASNMGNSWNKQPERWHTDNL